MKLAVDRIFFSGQLGEPGRLAVAQQLQHLVHHRDLRLGVLVPTFGLLLGRRAPTLQAFQIGQHEFRLDHLGVGQRIDAAFDVCDVIVLEAAQHVSDCINLADMRQELVTEALALGCTAHQTGDIDEGQPGRNGFRALTDLGKLVEARIRHAHFADVRLDGAKRVVGRLGRRSLRQRIEEGGFADVRQAHDTAFEAHEAEVLSGK